MDEQVYFQQFSGDYRTVPGYFVFSDNNADFGSLDKNECERVFDHMSKKFTGMEFEIRILEVSENWPND